MTNEITALEGTGNRRYQLLLLFPIVSPVQVAGANVVPNPSENLPEMAQTILAQGEKDTLDAGTAGFKTISFTADPSLSNPELVIRAREIYQAQKITFDVEYAERYKFAGVRIDES